MRRTDNRISNFMKVFLKSFVIIGLLLVTVCDSFALERASDGYYLIKDADDLVEYRDEVNGGHAIDGRLTADIDLSSVCGIHQNWEPINRPKLALKFDGGHHSVSNLYIDSKDDAQGLFYCVDYLHDLTVKNAFVRGGDFVGGVVGCGSGSDGRMVIDNCHFKGEVVGKRYVGGLLGGMDMDKANVFNCSNYGLVVGHDCVGGLIGYAMDCMITNCYNIGRVKAYYLFDGQYYTYEGIAGGIVGFYGGDVGNYKYYCLNACYNYAVISGIGVGNMIGKRGGQNRYLIQACAALMDINPESDYESNVSFMSEYSFQSGTLKKHLDNYRDKRPDYSGLFNMKLYLLAFEQSRNVDPYPHLPDITLSPSKSYVVNYRGDYDGLDVFRDGMALPTCDNELFHYEFEHGFNGKRVTSDTAVIVKRVLNENFLERDASGNYLISNAYELGLFRDAVNGGAFDINGRLIDDIDLSDIDEWEPIGPQDICCSQAYSGKFDGGNFTISGIHQSKFEFTGLFSHIKNAEINNVILRNSTVEGYYAGALCAYAESSLIANCGSEASVTGHFQEGAAGFIAVADQCKILNCFNIGEVTAEGRASGFVALLLNSSVVENCYASCEVANSDDGGLKSPFAFNRAEISFNNCYYNGSLLEDGEIYIVSETVKNITESEMKSQDFVDELNRIVEEINSKQETVDLSKWVIDPYSGYPSNGRPSEVSVEDLFNDTDNPLQNMQIYSIDGILYIQSDMERDLVLFNALGQPVRYIRCVKGTTVVDGLFTGIYCTQGTRVIVK